MGLLLRICRDRAERPQGAALSFVIGRSSSVHKSEFAGFEERANDAESEGLRKAKAGVGSPDREATLKAGQII